MKLPNKIISYKESVISKMPPILKFLDKSDKSILDTYKQVKHLFNNVQDFIDTLDCLFALNKISITEKEELHYVKRNIL
ncbi:hypothetical protein IJ384_03300 [bacterium]|nr:hypothetical protein [bacterium]